MFQWAFLLNTGHSGLLVDIRAELASRLKSRSSKRLRFHANLAIGARWKIDNHFAPSIAMNATEHSFDAANPARGPRAQPFQDGPARLPHSKLCSVAFIAIDGREVIVDLHRAPLRDFGGSAASLTTCF